MKKTEKRLPKIFLMVVVIVLSTSQTNLFAQEGKFGVKGGLNLSSLYIDEVDDENPRVGFHAGLYSQMPLGEFLALQPELLFTTKGAKGEYNISFFNGENEFNLHYIELPLLLVFDIADVFELHGGAYGAYLAGANISTDGDFGSAREELDRDNFSSFDYGFAFGFGLNLNESLQVGARYSAGLREIADSDVADVLLGDSKNANAQIFIAIGL